MLARSSSPRPPLASSSPLPSPSISVLVLLVAALLVLGCGERSRSQVEDDLRNPLRFLYLGIMVNSRGIDEPRGNRGGERLTVVEEEEVRTRGRLTLKTLVGIFKD
ncbi:hypothetical protein NL676_008253 [Syzygium grande]|nr:hypothetical protein NL676_008253 [Syzygium grande]